jgi:hypothetical protein
MYICLREIIVPTPTEVLQEITPGQEWTFKVTYGNKTLNPVYSAVGD